MSPPALLYNLFWAGTISRMSIIPSISSGNRITFTVLQAKAPASLQRPLLKYILMKKLLSTILKKFDYTLITLSDDAATTSFLCGFSGYTKGSSPVSSARIQKPVSGLFFIEISTFSTFLYRQIHPIKNAQKVLSEPHNMLSDA